MTLRFALPSDSPALLAIYAQYIDTPITFEYTLPGPQEFADRIAGISRWYPYLLCEEEGRAVGYAYAHRPWAREAYQWNAELSIYLAPSVVGQGLGRKLYRTLIELLRLQGIRTAYGCVTLPNPESEGLHRSLGFYLTGTYHDAGYKCGKWHDVGWFEREIAPHDVIPAPIRPFSEVPAVQVDAVLQTFS